MAFETGNAEDDDDFDGASNLHEYRAGTNPTNALSWLRFTQIETAGAGYQLVWSSVGGSRYRVQFSNGDANGSFNGVFTSVPRAVTDEMDSAAIGTAGTMSFTDDYTLTGGAPASGARYYRVEAIRLLERRTPIRRAPVHNATDDVRSLQSPASISSQLSTT